MWCDPRNGSGKKFLQALSDLAAKSKHPELETVPWCLWGHSGGGFWASLMQTAHPERIVAIWFRSGTAFAAWEKGEIPKPVIPAAADGIPMPTKQTSSLRNARAAAMVLISLGL